VGWTLEFVGSQRHPLKGSLKIEWLIDTSSSQRHTHCMAPDGMCSVWQCVAVCGSVLQCVAVCCSVWQCVAVSLRIPISRATQRESRCVFPSLERVLQCIAYSHLSSDSSVLQCVAACCSVWQCVAVYWVFPSLERHSHLSRGIPSDSLDYIINSRLRTMYFT